MNKLKILIINGPNLNLLSHRDKDTYQDLTYEELKRRISMDFMDSNIEFDFFQSNIEGEIIIKLHEIFKSGHDGVIINAGAYSHYSYAIRDAIEIIKKPVIEVHISNIYAREAFRHKSVLAPVCSGQILGLGYYSYFLAIEYIKEFYK